MQPARDTPGELKRLVAEGYDRCAAEYARQRSPALPFPVARLLERLAPGDAVLDGGCGSGVPVAAALAAHGCEVTGVDVSAEQIRLARRNVPGARFLCGDVMRRRFPPESLRAAVLMYSLFHLPREEHDALFRRLARWIAPGGWLLLTLANDDQPGYTEDGFFGTRMYWSNFTPEAYVRMLDARGFRVLEAGRLGHGYAPGAETPPESHPWLLCDRR